MNAEWKCLIRTALVPLAALTFCSVAVGQDAIPRPNPADGHRFVEIDKAGQAVVNGQIDEAYKLLLDAVAHHPELVPARLMLSRLYKKVNPDPENDAKYRAMLEQAVAENPDHPAVYADLASNAILEGRSSEALLDCQKVIELSAAPRWTATQKRDCRDFVDRIVATVHNNRREWESACSDLIRLLSDSPNNTEYRQEYARALLGLGKPDEAYRELAKAYDIYVANDLIGPKIARPSLGMANFYAAMDDAAKARRWFGMAVQEDEESFDIHIEYGEWLLKQDDLTAAKAHAEKAAKSNRENKRVIRLLRSIADSEKQVDIRNNLP